ncbi:MAG: saccharopine dehydrogenase [Gammaproteobacteria bacterium]|nr:saccharopine dehydrogenase [Gammaproteobacteria bacterium]
MREFDVVVFGATSFVGRILCRYLLDTYRGDGSCLRWAIAARSAARLAELKSELAGTAHGLSVIVADAADENAMRSLALRAKIVVSTVGPYALYGEPLVKACVETGTDYCDLTGEVQWIRRMIDRYESAAKASGARIVHCCGFDSIPSDFGVYFLQQAAMRRFGRPATHVKMRVRAMRGGFSGGTAASLLNVGKEVRANPALRKELANPYSLCVGFTGANVRQPNVSSAVYDADFKCFVAPFVMAAINTRIVHRSNALSGHAYSREFRYDEAVATGRGLQGRLAAIGSTAGLGAFMFASAIGPTRALLERFVLPKPGEGPSPEAQRRGFFDLRLLGRTDDGRVIRAKVAGDRDPGYGSTAKMLGEAAVCLALEVKKSERSGGFWTPSTMFGERLLSRLVSRAGLSFEIAD